MKLLKKITSIAFCFILAMQGVTITKASSINTDEIQIIEPTDTITSLEAGTYEFTQKTEEGTSKVVFEVGEIQEYQDTCSKLRATRATTANTYYRTLTIENTYYDANRVFIYQLDNTATFAWDGTNVWVTYCEMGVNKNSNCTMTVTSNYADETKAARQYAWYRVHVTFKSSTRTFYAVSDIGCSRFGDPMYITE